MSLTVCSSPDVAGLLVSIDHLQPMMEKSRQKNFIHHQHHYKDQRAPYFTTNQPTNSNAPPHYSTSAFHSSILTEVLNQDGFNDKERAHGRLQCERGFSRIPTFEGRAPYTKRWQRVSGTISVSLISSFLHLLGLKTEE